MSDSKKRRLRLGILSLAAALALFTAVMLISRLADLGVVPAERFGAGDWKRGKVMLDISVLPASGQAPRPLGNDAPLAVGDALEFSYGMTRYPYLWVLAVSGDGSVRPMLPAVPTGTSAYGLSTERGGEVVSAHHVVEAQDDGVALLGLFTAVPVRIEAFREAARKVDAKDPEKIARELHMPGRRFVYVLRVAGAK